MYTTTQLVDDATPILRKNDLPDRFEEIFVKETDLTMLANTSVIESWIYIKSNCFCPSLLIDNILVSNKRVCSIIIVAMSTAGQKWNPIFTGWAELKSWWWRISKTYQVKPCLTLSG